MVERPIKKSERAPGTGDEPKREARRESGDKDRKGGRGKGRDREEVKRGVSPALMRGPKPQPIKEEEPAPEVLAPEETTTEAVTEEVATEEAATEEAATEEAATEEAVAKD